MVMFRRLYSDIRYTSLPVVAIVDQGLTQHHSPVALGCILPRLGFLEKIVDFEIQRDRIEDQLVSGFVGLFGSFLEFVDQLPAVLSGPDGNGIAHGGES